MTQKPAQPVRPARSLFQVDAATLAHRLLGQRLVRYDEASEQRLTGRIVETEAYLGVVDRAAHTYGGRRTPRNESMWGEAGYAYVYFTYGMHYCMNIVARGPEQPEAVLLRAIEPEAGLALMWLRRQAARRDRDLGSGPAKLCQALSIDRALNGEDLLTSSRLWVEQTRQRAIARKRIVTGPRVGVSYAGAWAEAPLRFYIHGTAYRSKG